MIWIKYFLDGVEFAARLRDNVPRQNELIRFAGIGYRIKTVVWIEDEERQGVSIEIIKEDD